MSKDNNRIREAGKELVALSRSVVGGVIGGVIALYFTDTAVSLSAHVIAFLGLVLVLLYGFVPTPGNE